MATFLNSANFSGKNGTHFSANLYYDYSQSVENNRTTVTYYLYFQSKDGYSGSGSTVTGYINGTSVGTTTSIGVNENQYIGQLTTAPITHNSDGTFPSTSYSAMIDTPWTLGDASVSDNLTGLPTIPRASTPQLSNNNFNIGSSVTLTTNRKSTSFTHTVVLTFGSYTKTYTNVGDSQVINTSQFASNMYAQMPNAKSKTGTITTTTYNGSTQIGSASSLTFTANAVEGNVNPQITAVTYTVDSTTSSLANSTTFIKGVTNATINVTANRRMSATLTKVFLWYYSGTNKVVLSSQNVNADGTYTFTINGISVSKVYGGATDTRGYTTYNTSINNVPTTFKDYVTLTADTNATIKRIVQTEPNVRINSFTGNYWNNSFRSGNANTLTIKWRYKETTASSYSSQYTIPASSISISNNKYTISNYTLTNGSTTELFNYQKSYHIQISVTDKIGTKSVVYTITAGQPNFAIFPSATISNQEIVTTNARTKNMFDKNSTLSGYRFGSDGLPFADSSYSISDFISVIPSTTYMLSRGATTSGSSCVCWYASDKSFISRAWLYGDGQKQINTTSNTYYIRIADFTSNLGTIQFEKGTIVSSYTPFVNLNNNIFYIKTTYTSNGAEIRFEKYGRLVIVTFEGTTNTNIVVDTDYSVTISSSFTPTGPVRENVVFSEYQGMLGYIYLDGTTLRYRVKGNLNSPAYPRFSFTYIARN